MPLFVHMGDFTVVQRKHLYNSEAIDGLIKHIQDHEPCYLLGHSPTKSFTYDVFIKDELSADEGFKFIQKLPTQKSDDGRLYYSLVPIE
jgi:hypothetical protein